ncbi:MAG: AAA family ATPase [Verrucomicrobiota bacterium]
MTDTELRTEYTRQARTKLIHYADAHTPEGLKLRLLNLIDEGTIEFTDIDEICRVKPEQCAQTNSNFGLGELDDNRDLLIRDIHCNPDIIEGVLKSDTTGMFIGASKSYKTWHLIRLALCVAHGLPWFGMVTRKSKVLFINPELISNEFQSRVQTVARELNITHLDHNSFKSLSLHKRNIPPDDLMDAIENVVTRDKYELVILDSLYRLYGPRTDENSNGDMLRLLTRMEQMISNPNSAIIFSHHSPKGDQASKRSIDVAAGGGALGRFVATCITTRIVDEDAKRYSLEFTSRYHRHKDSIGLVMNGPGATLDTAFNKTELNGNSQYNNQAILNILATGSYTASSLQKAVKDQTSMSKSAFYESYWPTIQNVDGVTCVDGKFTYAKPNPATAAITG